MALIFCDGFDHYATADMLKKWDTGTSSLPVIQPNTGRRGVGALSCSTDVRLYKHIAPVQTVVVGFAFKPTGIGVASMFETTAILMLSDVAVSAHLGVFFLNDNSIRVGRYVSATNFVQLLTSPVNSAPVNAWTYVEIKATIDDVAGAVEMRINGVSVAAVAGVDTRAAGGAYVNRVSLGCGVASSTAALYDDFYLCDTTGVTNNNFLGDVRIDTLLPNADGTHTQFTPSTGTTHYTLVDEATTPDTSDYVSSSTVGHKELFGLTNLSSVGSILGIQVNSLTFKDDAGTRSGANLIRSGSSEAQGAAKVLGISPVYNVSVHETDPATGATWTLASVNALEAGAVVAA